MKLQVLDLAEADLLSGFKFYEGQSAEMCIRDSLKT